MPKNKARDRLIYLCEKIARGHEIDISLDPETEGDVNSESLSGYGIRVLNLDVESLDDEEASLASHPPYPFQAPPQLGIGHVSPYSGRKCNTHVSGLYSSWGSVSWQSQDVESHSLPEPFWNLPVISITPLDNASDRREYSVPNPYLYGMEPPSSIKGGKWTGDVELECAMVNGKPTSPYVALATLHYYNGREGSILWAELANLITAMCNRAIQPDIDIQTWGSYGERGYILKEEIGDRLVFPKEKHFPVVMLSFVGPQHGRIFYACMDGEQLVIRQSRLFSFEQKANAPFALFQRILLSRPIDS